MKFTSRLNTQLATAFCGLLLNSGLATAAIEYDVNVPDKTMIGKTPLVLNGVGLRTATFLRVKVYVAGLYLEKPSTNADEVVGSKQLKKISLHFKHKVPKAKLVEAWSESFEKNCKKDCEGLKPSLDKLTSMLTDFQENDLLAISFFPTSVEVQVKDGPQQKIEGESFSKLLLLTWLGPNPPSTELKEGLLGINKKK